LHLRHRTASCTALHLTTHAPKLVYKSNTKLMKLSTKIKLEYWQAVTTGVTHDTLEAMLTKAIDKMEEEIKNNPSCKGILDDSDQ
jgi:hypothetical protein